MLPVLFLLFLVLPIVELAVIIQVGQVIGVLNTIALLLLVSVIGSWLVKREGLGVWRRFRHQMETGHVPGKEVADGMMIMLAGALLISPGFVTDCVGILLLLPPVRAAIRGTVLRRLAMRVQRF
ncbi:MAG: FxsA family protein [Acidimicrobiia bacterium]